MAAQEHLDHGAVFPHDGCVELSVQLCAWAFHQGQSTVPLQSPAASLGYVSHEKIIKSEDVRAQGRLVTGLVGLSLFMTLEFSSRTIPELYP